MRVTIVPSHLLLQLKELVAHFGGSENVGCGFMALMNVHHTIGEDLQQLRFRATLPIRPERNHRKLALQVMLWIRQAIVGHIFVEACVACMQHGLTP